MKNQRVGIEARAERGGCHPHLFIPMAPSQILKFLFLESLVLFVHCLTLGAPLPNEKRPLTPSKILYAKLRITLVTPMHTGVFCHADKGLLALNYS